MSILPEAKLDILLAHHASLEAPAGSVSVRQKLTEFAEAEGLSL